MALPGGLVIALVALLGDLLVGYVAWRKGYPVQTWLLLGLLVWPVALLLLVLKPNLRTTRVCPDCRARVPYDAPVCRHCGRDVRHEARS